MKKGIALLALWVLVVGAGIAIENRHEQMLTVSSEPRDSADVMLDAVGEFRTVMARYLWFKMDLYHEVLEGTESNQAQQDQIIPLLRMVSLLDPSITDSYDLMAWEMAGTHQDPTQALVLLAEGLKKNPKSWPLAFRKSLIEFEGKQYDAALSSSQLACELAVEEFDQINSYRVMYWSAKKLNRQDAMVKAINHLIALRPNDQLWTREQAAMEPGHRDHQHP